MKDEGSGYNFRQTPLNKYVELIEHFRQSGDDQKVAEIEQEMLGDLELHESFIKELQEAMQITDEKEHNAKLDEIAKKIKRS
jgi:hypothetical protein